MVWFRYIIVNTLYRSGGADKGNDDTKQQSSIWAEHSQDPFSPWIIHPRRDTHIRGDKMHSQMYSFSTYLFLALIPGPQNRWGFSWKRDSPFSRDFGFASGRISMLISLTGSRDKSAAATPVSLSCRTGCDLTQYLMMSHRTLAGASVLIDIRFACEKDTR